MISPLTIVLLLGVAALGGVTDATLLAILLAVCGFAGLRALLMTGGRSKSFWVALLGLVTYCAAVGWQLVPWPDRLLRRFAPQTLDLWQAGDSSAGLVRTAHPISLDPPSTWFALATALSCLLLFVALGGLRESDRARVIQAVSRAIAVFAVIGIAGALLGRSDVFGLYRPHDTTVNVAPLRPTLLNPNHAAAVLAVGPPLFIGRMFEAKGLPKRFMLAGGATLTAVATALTLSRSGLLVLALELGALLLVGLRSRRGRGTLPLSFGVLLGFVAAAALAAQSPLLRELQDHDTSKLRLATTALTTLRGFAPLGVGRGCFDVVFHGRTQGFPADVRFTHVESWPIAWVVELGLPLTLLTVAVFATATGLAIWEGAARRPQIAGAGIALIGLLVHDLFDFSLDYVGTGLIAASLLAVLVSNAPANSERLSRLHQSSLVLVAMAALWAVFQTWSRRPADAVLALAAAPTRDMAHRAIAQHPAEPALELLAGMAEGTSNEAGAHFVRAVNLAPHWGHTHRLLARWLVRTQRMAQAWAEYRQAIRVSPGSTASVYREMASAGASIPELRASATTGAQLEVLTLELQKLGHEKEAEALEAELIARFPPAIEAHSNVTRRLLAANKIVEARAVADHLVQVAPDAPRGYVLQALSNPDRAAAETLLESTAKRWPNDEEALRELIRARGLRLGLASVTAEIDRLRELVVQRQGAVELVHVFLAQVETARKDYPAAIQHYRNAVVVAEDPKPHLEAIASLAELSGQQPLAAATWLELTRLSPGVKRYAEGYTRCTAPTLP